MSEKRFTLELQNKDIFDKETNTFYCDSESVCELLNTQQSEINSLKMELELISGEKLFSRRELERKVDEQQTTINKLRKILAEAEDTIEVRLAEHYLKEYENIKHNIIGDNDE
jgi:predicted RNase H-like nuclease (RuvC/YqgF family)